MEAITVLLSQQSKKPLYLQLYEALTKEIKEGRCPAGERMPSRRRLAEHLKISLNTVDSAYQMLAAEGYIKSVPRSGYTVCPLERLPVSRETPPPIPAAAPMSALPYDFSISTVDAGAFPFSTWARISKDVMYHQPELLAHGDRQGDSCLREALSRYLRQARGVRCAPEQIVVVSGMEYLLMILCELIGREKVFAVENPGYPRVVEALSNAGGRVRPLSMDGDGLSAVELSVAGASAAYITPSHQFPTGTVMPIGRRSELLCWAYEQPGRYIIEDDYDSEFRFSGRPIPALQGMDSKGRVVYIGTFSRSIAPSIRISYMILPPELLERYRAAFSRYSASVSRFEQHTLYRFLEGGYYERHLNRSRSRYKKRLETLVGCLRQGRLANKIQVIGAQAGLHFLLQVQNGMTERELIDKARLRGVKIAGLSSYCFPPLTPSESTLIMGYAHFTSQQIREAAALLEQVWSN